MFKAILKTVKQEKTKSTISDKPDINQIPSISKQIDNTPQFFNSILDYKKFQILNTIDTIYYIRNVLTQEQQDYLIDEIYLQQRWIELPHSKRRVQKYGGDVENNGLKNIEPLPIFLKQLSALTFLDNKNIVINHVLINEYSPGVGIQQHFDGPLYYPFVNIFSLNSNCIFKFTQNNQIIKLFIEPGSLLIFSKNAYTQWLHGIDYYESDTILLLVHEGKVIKSDVINIEISEIDKLIKNKDNEYCPLIDNNQYNAALIIKRKKRLSITMRNVYA